MPKQYKKINEKVYTAEDNFIGEIKEFFLAVACVNGKEGVIAQIDLNRFPPVEKPLMGATQEDREAILRAAESASNNAGIKIKVLRFTQHEVVKTFYPKGSH